MKLLKSLTAAATILGFASTASATLHTYSYPNSDPIMWIDDYQTFEGSFTSLLAGIDWNTTTIVKAVIEFGFSDTWEPSKGWSPDWHSEFFSATAGSGADKEQLQLEDSQTGNNGNSTPQDNNLDIEGGTSWKVEVNGEHGGKGYDYREANLDNASLDDIKNGSLDFTVKSEGGDAWLKTARLKIETATKPTTSVPDAGSTVALLASAFAGLIALRRKFRK